MMHEHEAHQGRATFITLTYANDYLPENFSLDKVALQLYFKRVRKHYMQQKIKYYACGEYGEKTNRPHYHIIMFGIAPNDYERLDIKHNFWPYGHTHLGHSVEAEACAYVAKYVTKMIRSKQYSYAPRERPFQLQSQGLGKRYAQRYAQDIKKNYT